MAVNVVAGTQILFPCGRATSTMGGLAGKAESCPRALDLWLKRGKRLASPPPLSMDSSWGVLTSGNAAGLSFTKGYSFLRRNDPGFEGRELMATSSVIFVNFECQYPYPVTCPAPGLTLSQNKVIAPNFHECGLDQGKLRCMTSGRNVDCLLDRSGFGVKLVESLLLTLEWRRLEAPALCKALLARAALPLPWFPSLSLVAMLVLLAPWGSVDVQ